MTTATSELLPGYRTDPVTGAWTSLPWPDDPAEKQRIAANSLGPLLIRWAEGRLTPEEYRDFGPGLVHHLTGAPWRWTPGQKRFLVLWYAYDEDGRYLYRSGIFRGSKGTGKDPFAGAHANCELVGPTLLVRDDDGNWTGIPHRMALVQVASNSETQSKDVLRVANGMWSREAKAWHGLNTGETRTLAGNSRFEVLTASEASAEGDPATFIVLNESQHMTRSSGGHRVSAVAQRNVGKSPRDMQARLVEYTNAHGLGSDSIAERSFDAWQKQVSGQFPNLRHDILYGSIEADPALSIYDMGQLNTIIDQAYSDAPWHDKDRLIGEVLDPRLSPAEAIRYYANGLAAREDAWIDPRNWDKLAAPDEVITDRTPIAMFLDCSKSEDATAFVGCRISDGYVFTLGVWQPPKGVRGKGWTVPREDVDAKVRETMQRYRVLWFGVDPGPMTEDQDDTALFWTTLIDSWHRDFHRKLKLWATPGDVIGNAVKFDMRLSQRGGHDRVKAFTEMAELTARWIDEDYAFRHDGSTMLRLHVHQAHRRANQWGISLGKETRDSNKLIDLAVAMVGALLGRQRILNSTKVHVGRGGRTSRREAVVL